MPQTYEASYSRQQTRLNSNASVDSPRPARGRPRAARRKCDESLLFFLEHCFPNVFTLGWSPDHIAVIDDIQRHIEHGGLKAIGMPRGTGKTSILLRAAIWAILTGRRRFVCIVAADEYSAIGNLETIKTEINFNDQLIDLYAWETWLIRQLDGEGRRSNSQHWDGVSTGVDYGQRTLCFGTVPNHNCLTNGAVITTAGITGRIRGQQMTTVSGEVIRPDFVLCDDPQTKLSAASPSQCQKRHETMMGDVLGLAGPGIRISGFATCTVIYQDDLAERLLSRALSADWDGSKVSMIKKWPKNLEKWDEYNTLRLEELGAGEGRDRSCQFVLDHFDEMHEEAEVYWEDRKSDKDVSALQHAMDLYYRDPGVFFSEFQNKPMALAERAPYEINVEEMCRRVTGLQRARVPNEVDKITAFIDVQRELLYYVIVAWAYEGRGYIIDYGSCPDQKRITWTKSTVANTLQQEFGDDIESCLRGGLDWLVPAIMETEYTTDNGSLVQVDRLAIDSRWGESTHIVRRFCRESRHGRSLHPSMGVFVGANSKPWQRLGTKKEQKERRGRGIHAKLKTPEDGGRRELLYDTNYWKSFVADRLTCDKSNIKAITMFDAPPHHHRMFADHCVAEEPLRVLGRTNNEVVEWKPKVPSGQIENDYWDCLVGNAALASTIGVETHEGNRKNTAARGAMLRRVMQFKNPDRFFRDR